MNLFSRIPGNFFSILASPKKELYVEALFVLRQAFKTELVIKRKDLLAMFMDSLEDQFNEADFSEEAEEEGDGCICTVCQGSSSVQPAERDRLGGDGI